MALLDSEVRRIRAELGYNAMGLQAMPYIGISAIFDGVIQQYITGGATTTSATPVTAATTPTPQTLTLGSGTGFHAGDRVVIDVDARQEIVTVQNMPGAATITVLLQKTHSGTYPVTVEGGESLVRECLTELNALVGAGGYVSKQAKRAGIAKVDEVEFFGGAAGAASGGKDGLAQTKALVEFWRDRLAEVLGVERLNRRGGTSCELY